MANKEYIDRAVLLAEYDRVHVGAPGGARKLIADAPAADVVEAPKWINVKDRLPEESDNYLVYFENHAAVIAYSAVHRAFNTFDDQTEFWVENTRVFPRYWMPLPEPPREAT